MKEKHVTYSQFIRSTKNPVYKVNMDALQIQLNSAVQTSKAKYYEKFLFKLSDKKASNQCHWLILKTLLNRKKVLVIPPILNDNKLIVDIKVKC